MTSGNNSGSNPPHSQTQKRPLYYDDTERLTPSELEQLRQERRRDGELIREVLLEIQAKKAAAAGPGPKPSTPTE